MCSEWFFRLQSHPNPLYAHEEAPCEKLLSQSFK